MPDTYDYVLGMSDLEVLGRAHKEMQAFLAREWAARDPSVPLATPYEALILASLVEKETAVPLELAKVAGVFERRLRLGMHLQRPAPQPRARCDGGAHPRQRADHPAPAGGLPHP